MWFDGPSSSLDEATNLAIVVFRSWWFDPFVATLSFYVWIHIYWYYERRYGCCCSSTSPRFTNASDITNFFSIKSQPFRITFGYWVGISMLRCVIAAPQLPDGIPTSIIDGLFLGFEVVTGVVAYDFVFFFLHLAMHEIPTLRKYHSTHHQHYNSGDPCNHPDVASYSSKKKNHVESRDVLRHSLVDATLQVSVNVLVQRYNLLWFFTDKTRLARALHNVIVTWMLTESHTSSPKPYIWRRWFVGVREHRIHHAMPLANGRSCHVSNSDVTSPIYYGHHHRYQQFFGYLDDLRFQYVVSTRNERAKRKAK